MGRFIDITNQVFGEWTIIKKGSYIPDGHFKWICKCSCGHIKELLAKTLKRGESKGCRKCMSKRTISSSPLAYRHGMSHTPTYRVWSNINARCHNPNDTGYKWYGALGIKVCDKWRKDFLNFYKDMGERPPQKCIDRIDPLLGYYKENCKWSTTKEQNWNKKNNCRIDNIYNGWKIIELFRDEYKAKAECIFCKKIVIRATSSLKSRKCICHSYIL